MQFVEPIKEDEKWMQAALLEAQKAAQADEVPVGAVLVKDNAIIAHGFNQPICSHDPTAHAEVVVLRKAAQTLQNYRLTGTTLYVTLEPCIMCLGALIHARVARLVYAASDPKVGAIKTLMSISAENNFNHSLHVTKNVLNEHSSNLLKYFFKKRR